MLSETLEKELSGYAIGPKIRALRSKKKLSLVQLGEHSSLSPALLSKIERGQIFPTLPTLMRIALVFGVGLDHFFIEAEDGPAFTVVRKNERMHFPGGGNGGPPAYRFESLDFPASNRRMEAFYAEFEQGTTSQPHTHEGAEVVYVMTGELAVGILGEESVLAQGDSIYFDSGQPHSYRRIGRAACSAIVVVTVRDLTGRA